MSKKIKLTRKDSYLIIIGVLISFMIQSLTDALHISNEIFHTSLTIQFFSAILTTVIFVILTVIFLRNLEETS
jgi:hypothetical protein